jgi:aerobic carbon-monoxide dehydrogenase large subunit
MPPTGGIPALGFSGLMAGPYRTQHVTAHTTGVYTNRPPISPYRGAGRPEATYALERALDLAARAIGIDPAEVRRRNFIGADEFPYRTPTRSVYDSGNYAPALEKALSTIGYAELRAEQERLRGEGRYIGIGLTSFVESSVPQSWESGTVRVDRGGKVTLFTGSSAHGQGHHTTFAQIVADQLTVPIEDVEVVHGDTAAVPVGIGTFGSRSAALGGSSAMIAASRVRTKMEQIAANLLEVGAADVQLEAGRFGVAGVPGKGVPFAAVASAAYAGAGLSPGMAPGLEETEFFSSQGMSFPFGTHVAVVEVSPETGDIRILRYVAVDDCGNVINPMLVEGQVHGGIAQGLGQALLEQVVYDENGQLHTGTLMEYAVPRADTMPALELDHTVTPSPLNPLGVKGVGEAGTTAAPAAVANAVIDALVPFGVTDIDMPLTPPRVWAAIQAVSRSDS